MGASWDVFYSFLERVLGTKNSSGTSSGGDGIIVNTNNDNNDIDNNEKMTDPQSSTDTLSLPSLSDTQSQLENSKPTTLVSFYSLVIHAYYRIEPFVHRVNFEFTEQQRKVINSVPLTNYLPS